MPEIYKLTYKIYAEGERIDNDQYATNDNQKTSPQKALI